MKTVATVFGVVASVAAIATGVGALLGGTMMLSIFGTTVAASTIAAAASAVSVGASLLSKPSSPEIGTANHDRLQASINVRAPRVLALGSTALATDLRDQEFTGTDKEYLHRFFVVAAHRVQAIREIWFDDKLAWTSTGGVQGSFSGYLTVTPVLEGAPGNAINISSRMGNARRFTGCAYVHLRFKLTGNSKKTESPFAQQVPTRMTIVGDGMRCYDPRQDSTRPGGSGPHRATDQSTWTWGEHARNPACQLATVLLGWRIQNPQSGTWKLSVGCGIPADRIDWPSFIDGANLCDEPVALAAGGTEPRYRAGGLLTEADGPTRWVEALKAAMNADLDDQDGLLRLTVFHNDLATPDADFTAADIQNEYVWLQTRALNDSFNVVRGNYVEPASLYQPAPYREAAVPSPDGIERVHPADFGLVQGRGQAERLAKQRLQRQLYGGEFRATFLATGWKVQKNSVIRLSFAPEGWTNKLFRVADIETGHDGLVPMVLREEHEDIYAWDAEESPSVQLAEPTHYAPGEAPIPQFLGTIEEGATVGAPPGTPVATRPAEDVVGDIDHNANTILANIYDTQVLRDYADARLYVEGEPVNAVVALEKMEREAADEAFAQMFALIGAVHSGGTAFVLNTDTVRIGGTPITGYFANAETVSFLAAQLGSAQAEIAEVREVVIDPAGGAQAKAVLQLDVNGRVVGVFQTNNGEFGKMTLLFDSVEILDLQGSSLFLAEGGVVKMPNVEIEKIKLGAVGTQQLSEFAIRKPYSAQLANNVNLPTASFVVVTSVTITKDLANSDVIVKWMMRMRPGASYQGFFRLVRVIGGSSVTLDTVQYWLGTVGIDGIQSVRTVQPYERRFAGHPEGSITYRLEFVYGGHEGSWPGGFIEAGSELFVEEVKRG